MDEKQQLMQKLQTADFALFDTVLYLDTHPTDQSALNYYDKIKQVSESLREEYISKFGPLFNSDVESSNMFSWVNNPWPWEVDA